MTDYLAMNRSNWDERVPAHVASRDYAVARFIEDPGFLSGVVRFDLPRLGDIRGCDGLHLQCHIGTDTLSLARLGATMTGLDFSGPAVEQGRRLAEATGTAMRFVQSEVYDALNVLEPGSFDLVYTGIGAISWLPDIRLWAQTVAGLLRPGGRLFIRDAHPMLLTLEAEGERLTVDYPYFERREPIVFEEAGTYVETDFEFATTTSASWNHGLGEIFNALAEAGLQVTGLDEHDSSPWEAFRGLMVCDEAGEWRLREQPWRIAATFTLQARRLGG